MYAAPLAGVGDYAVIAPPGQARVPEQTVPQQTAPQQTGTASSPAGGAATTPTTSPSYARPVLVILGVALLALVAVIGAVRFGRGRGSG